MWALLPMSAICGWSSLQARASAEQLNGVDFSLGRRQILGIVGESGAGKSTIAMALVNLIAHPGPDRFWIGQLQRS